MAKAAKYKLEQVAIRMVKEPPLYSDTPIITAQDAVGVIAKALSDYDREVFGVINVKADGRPANMNIASMGTVSGSLVSTREVLKSTILSNVDRVLFFHNHPSGNLHPSKQDIQMTDKLLTACGVMDIGVMDHIILGGGNEKEYYSFLEKGVLTVPEIFYKSNIDELDFAGKACEGREIQYAESRYCRRTDGEKQKAGESAPEQGRNERVSVKGKLEGNRGKVEIEKGKGKGRDRGLG